MVASSVKTSWPFYHVLSNKWFQISQSSIISSVWLASMAQLKFDPNTVKYPLIYCSPRLELLDDEIQSVPASPTVIQIHATNTTNSHVKPITYDGAARGGVGRDD